MARKAKKKAKPETLTRLSVRVQAYDASSEVRVNYYVRYPEHAFRDHSDDLIVEDGAFLTVRGVGIDPPERAGEEYEFTIRGTDAPSAGLAAKLKDAQVRGEYGAPQYRKYRGGEIPVYDPPPGLGLLQKVRGEPRWTGWVTVAPRLVTDWLILLGSGRDLYLDVLERKKDRSRWIDSIELRTQSPEGD